MSNVSEQSSTFSKTTKKSVQVFQSSGSFDQKQDSSLSDSSLGLVFKPTILNFDSLMGSMGSEFEDVSRDVCQVNDGQMFETKFDVQGYDPKEIQVKVADNLVTVSAKQEQKSESSSSFRQFSKKFTIPPGVKPESISCTFTTDGQLKISAPIERSQQSITSSQQKQVTKSQARQDSTTSSRKSSISSDVSIRDFDEFVLRPRRLNLSSLMSNTNTENLSREVANTNDGKKFEIKLEIKNFKAEEVQVKITKTLIKIEGKHESEFASRSFYKEQTIPYGVIASSITCSMNDDGILTISAPIQQSQQQLCQQQSVNSSSTKQQQQVSSTSTNVQQQQQQVSSTNVQQQQTSSVHKTLQETGRMDSSESMSSTKSSVREATSRRLEDMVLRPEMNFDFDALMRNRESQFEDVSKQICHVNEGKKFEVKVEVAGYNPNELQIKIANNMVIIEAKQETATSSRQFYKKFSIPAGVTPEKITSSLSPQGVLTISAPIETSTNTNTNRTEQQVQHQTQTSSVRQEVKQQQQQQQQHSDSNTSINSNLSSISSNFDRDFILRPIMNMDFDSIMRNREAQFEDVSKQICHVNVNEVKKFEVKIEVIDYKPEEIQVKIANNMVIIEAKQETATSSRQFYKKFSIPAGVTPEKITSSLSPQGVLTISAPIDANAPNVNRTEQQVLQQTQTSTSTVQKEVQQQQQKQHQQHLQQQQHSDSNSSINSTLSNVSSNFDRDFILRPIMNIDFDSIMRNRESQFEDVSKQICHVNEGKKFEVKIEVVDYKPEEIQVKIANNMVIIEAKQETATSSRQFYKKFSIPAGVTPEKISSSLSPQGVLTVSAPIEVTSTNVARSEQQVKSQTTESQSVRRDVQQSDSNSTINSNISSISSKLDRDCILRPIVDFNAILAKDGNFEDISKQICQVSDGKKFETKVQVEGYNPNELQIKISNNMVTISGKQESRQENNFSSKSFFKKFSIPSGVKPENITSSLSPQGVLTISAPVTEITGQMIEGSNAQQSTVTSSTSVTRSEQVNVSGNQNQRGQQIILKPKINTNSLISSVHSSFDDISKDLYHVCDGQTFEMKVPAQGYEPNEIEIKISENVVTIEGKQEMRQENNFKSRQFCKKFTIPSGVKPESISCTFGMDGVLQISAPIDSALAQGQIVESAQNQVASQQTSSQQSTKKVSQTFSSTTSSTSSQQQEQSQVSSQQQLQ